MRTEAQVQNHAEQLSASEHVGGSRGLDWQNGLSKAGNSPGYKVRLP